MMILLSACCRYQRRWLLMPLLLLLAAPSDSVSPLRLMDVQPTRTPKPIFIHTIEAISSHDLQLDDNPHHPEELFSPKTAQIRAVTEFFTPIHNIIPRGGGPAMSTLSGIWDDSEFRQWLDEMARKYLSRDTYDAVQTIGKIIQEFPEYGVVDLFGMYSKMNVMWSIEDLYRLQQFLETREPSTIDRRTIVTDKRLLEELAHYLKFASAAYGWKGSIFTHKFGSDYGALSIDDAAQLAKATGIDRRDIVTAKWSSERYRPAYFVARDIERKSIVLAIRGTFSTHDILTDLCASYENCGNYRAHMGMVYAAGNVTSVSEGLISEELDAHPDYQLIVVGHSLGGGVAAIIAAMWKRRFRNRVRSIGYGNPCVFPLHNPCVFPLNVARGFDNIITVELGGDPIPTISLGHLADSTKAISKLCQDRDMRDGILERLRNSQNISRDDCEWCSNAMMFLRRQMDSEKLYPPGTIYKITSIDEGTFLTSTDATAFNELKLHTNMFDLADHLPRSYRVLLQRLAS